jgi:hypothetical protein
MERTRIVTHQAIQNIERLVPALRPVMARASAKSSIARSSARWHLVAHRHGFEDRHRLPLASSHPVEFRKRDVRPAGGRRAADDDADAVLLGEPSRREPRLTVSPSTV